MLRDIVYKTTSPIVSANILTGNSAGLHITLPRWAPDIEEHPSVSLSTDGCWWTAEDLDELIADLKVVADSLRVS